MTKRIIEHDLLKILKNKKKEEIIDTILNIGNGTYKFEIEYLNEIPYNEMAIYLEKIIVLGTNRKLDKENIEESCETIIYFANNISNINIENITKLSIGSLKYRMLLNKEKKQKNISKNATAPVAVILAGIVFISGILYLVSKSKKDEETFLSTEVVATTEISSEFVQEPFALEPLDENQPIKDILNLYNLTENEFNILCAIVMAEAKSGSYEDAYAVINTIYNRTQSKSWVEYISQYYGENVGNNLYYQATTPGQFVVYEKEKYVTHLNVREGEAYRAILDFLLNKRVKHNYLSFRSADTEVEEYVQFVEGGNKYFDILLDNDRIYEDEINIGRK